MPASSEAARKEWRLEADQVAQFVDEECAIDPAGEVQASTMFDAYSQWADNNGIQRKVTMKSFRDRLTALGYGSRRTKVARMVTGLRIGSSRVSACQKCDDEGCHYCR